MTERTFTKRIGVRVTADPVISVIIPNYNTAQYIAETLESVFIQTLTNFEVIVINDASPDTDDLPRVLEPFFESIVYIDKTPNEGTAAARNFAVEHARAPVIAFLDADDIWLPTFLQELYGFMTAGKYQMAYADGETFLSGRSEKYHDFLDCNPEQGRISRRQLIEGRCHILPSGTIIRKDSFASVGGFDPAINRTEDFDLWMRLLFRGIRIGYLRKILFKFRLRPNSGSGDYVARIRRTRDIWITLQQKLNFTVEEICIIERHIGEVDAAIARTTGRLLLVKQDWPAAREMFAEASRLAGQLGLPFSHRLRMRTVCFLLLVHPPIVLKLFRSLRPSEREFIDQWKA